MQAGMLVHAEIWQRVAVARSNVVGFALSEE